MDRQDAIGLAIISLIAGLLVGSIVTGYMVHAHVGRQDRVQAVKAGIAEWVVDESGNVSFKWKGRNGH